MLSFEIMVILDWTSPLTTKMFYVLHKCTMTIHWDVGMCSLITMVPMVLWTCTTVPMDMYHGTMNMYHGNHGILWTCTFVYTTVPMVYYGHLPWYYEHVPW